VSLGRAGIVLGLECSRLARNSADWHQLLELCAMTGTLICDEDGLYDPRNFNDRLLLGMKGQMSEALCGLRHNASYADVVVMPIATALLPGRGRAGDVAVGIIYSPSRKARSLSGGR
jgi:Resolvase, N terminal domain